MDLGISVTDVLTYASATIAGLGVIFAFAIGLNTVIGVAKKFLRTR